MKKTITLIFLIAGFNLLNSCKGHPNKESHEMIINKQSKMDSSITLEKIVFSTGACLGTCPVMAIEFDKEGNYKFLGVHNAPKEGSYTGTIPKEIIKQTEDLLNKAKIESLAYHYYLPDDAPARELIIYYNNQKKKKITGIGDAPESLWNLIFFIQSSVDKATLKKSKQKLEFESHVYEK